MVTWTRPTMILRGHFSLRERVVFMRSSVTNLLQSCSQKSRQAVCENEKCRIDKCLCGICKVEPMSGIEPPTYGLRNRCSTTELHWLLAFKTQYVLLLFSPAI